MTIYVLNASAAADLLLDTVSGRSLVDQLESGAEWCAPSLPVSTIPPLPV